MFPYTDLLYVSFKHILISLTSFMGTPNSKRILYNISLLTELWAFFKSIWIADVLSTSAKFSKFYFA
jgi:hypothetical protein